VEPLKDEAQAAKEGEAEHTPLTLMGGVAVIVGIVAGLVVLIALLVWWLA
jgi:hypothetical protein